MMTSTCEKCYWPCAPGYRLCVWHMLGEDGQTRPPPIDGQGDYVFTVKAETASRWSKGRARSAAASDPSVKQPAADAR